MSALTRCSTVTSPVKDLSYKSLDYLNLEILRFNPDFSKRSAAAFSFWNHSCQHVLIKTPPIVAAIFEGRSPIISSSSSTVLGVGSHGTVTEVVIFDTPYAAKYCDDDSLEEEVRNYTNLPPHPHILTLVAADDHTLYLTLAKKGSLNHLLNTEPSLSYQALLVYLTHVASAIGHIHENNCVYRDLKLDNILITEFNKAMLGDLSTLISTSDFNPKDLQGTVFYLPPEYLRGNCSPKHSQKIDIWSFGMLIWFALKKDEYHNILNMNNPECFIWNMGQHFQGCDNLDTQLDPEKIARLDPNNLLRSIMQGCLAITPDHRPTIQEIHDQLKSLDLADT